MRIAYADPPYLGLCKRYNHHHPDGRCWDDLETHRALIQRLSTDFDRWALSLHSPALAAILPLCPPDVRVLAWVKPFAAFKKNVRLAYTWEPIIVRGAPSNGSNGINTVKDHCIESITLRRGFVGAKPAKVCRWLFSALLATPSDQFTDLFPGSGAVTAAWRAYCVEAATA